MVRDRRWPTILTALMLVGLATGACGPLDSGESPTPTPTLPPPQGGRCGDGLCDEVEQARPDLCPQDCAVAAGQTPQPTQAARPAETPLGPGPGLSESRCGDGGCDGPENAQNCPEDCALPTAPAASSILPLYITVYYHVEPNRQLFEAVEPGYFEAVSLSLRDMSSSLASHEFHATFCFSWLYNDLVYCRNRDPQTGRISNSPADTGLETYEQILADGHELAYHTHPPMAIVEGSTAYYARPNSTCDDFSERHRWPGLGADANYDFSPGVYRFDDPADPWYGQFTWERTTESLFLIADHLGATIRHANGGQRPLLDITNKYGSGINHEHGIQQIRSLMGLGLDLLAPEVMLFFSPEYAATGPFWADSSTGYVAYLGPEANIQIYYPNIDGGHLENATSTSQGVTFMPVQRAPQAAWMSQGVRDDNYYNTALRGGTGGGGVRWIDDTFYAGYQGQIANPWTGESIKISFPSLAGQFNNVMQRHLTQTPTSVNAWGFNHHVVNVMRADLSGLGDNWYQALLFMGDIADGVADGVVDVARPDLVQFVTMQELGEIYDSVVVSATR